MMIQNFQIPKCQVDLKKRFIKDFLLDQKCKDVKLSQDGKIIIGEFQGSVDLISQSKILIEDRVEFKLKLLSQDAFGVLNIGVRNTQNSSIYFSFYGSQYQVYQQIFPKREETLQVLLDMTQQKISCIIGNQQIQKDLIKERSRFTNQIGLPEIFFPEGLINDPSSEWYLFVTFTQCCIQILDE